MAQFSFNFGGGETQTEEECYDEPLMPATEVFASAEVVFDNPEPLIIKDGITLVKGSVPSSTVAELVGDERAATSDVVSGKYEGGFKLWEGAVDLCKHLVEKYKLTPDMLFQKEESPLQGKRVLELGCGHGLPGILMAMAGADVHFQDFNEGVLKKLTVPNALANFARMGRSRPSVRFFSGDWLALGELLTGKGHGGYYDIIITSETIYNERNYGSLVECIKQVLQPPHGVVLVASKRYYFGVGGGTKAFQRFVKEDGIFEVQNVFSVEDKEGGNVREVLELSFPLAIQPYFL